MINAREAAESAAEYLKELKNIYQASLEEIELSDDRAIWNVTLSYTSNNVFDQGENYKIFKVDAESGEVLSMKIRHGE